TVPWGIPVPCPSPAPALLPPAGEGARSADAGAFCRKVKSCPHPNPLPLAGEGEERWEERASAAAVNVFQPNNVVLAQVPTRLHLDQLHRLRAAVPQPMHAALRNERALVLLQLEHPVI